MAWSRDVCFVIACLMLGACHQMSVSSEAKAAPAIAGQLSGRSVISLFDGRAELYLAYAEGAKREIVMRQFFEKRPDLGEIAFMKDVPWEEPLPTDAELFVPTSGLGRNVLKAFWLGWRRRRTL